MIDPSTSLAPLKQGSGHHTAGVGTAELKCTPLLRAAAGAMFAATPTFVSYDSVDASQLPADTTHCSYYANGPYANLDAVRSRFPHAVMLPVLVISQVIPPLKDVVSWQHGVEIDIEPTDWVPAEAGSYARAAISQGVMPVCYCSLSDVPAVVASLKEAGIARDQFRLHTAHWTGQAHICSGIETVMGSISADATQWWDRVGALNCDVSLCRSDFMSGLPSRRRSSYEGTGKAYFQVPDGVFDLDTGTWSGSVQGRRAP